MQRTQGNERNQAEQPPAENGDIELIEVGQPTETADGANDEAVTATGTAEEDVVSRRTAVGDWISTGSRAVREGVSNTLSNIGDGVRNHPVSTLVLIVSVAGTLVVETYLGFRNRTLQHELTVADADNQQCRSLADDQANALASSDSVIRSQSEVLSVLASSLSSYEAQAGAPTLTSLSSSVHASSDATGSMKARVLPSTTAEPLETVATVTRAPHF